VENGAALQVELYLLLSEAELHSRRGSSSSSSIALEAAQSAATIASDVKYAVLLGNVDRQLARCLAAQGHRSKASQTLKSAGDPLNSQLQSPTVAPPLQKSG
jgi:hypothetical protein